MHRLSLCFPKVLLSSLKSLRPYSLARQVFQIPHFARIQCSNMTGATNSASGGYKTNGTHGEANIVGKATKNVLAIGGTGAQGSSVVRGTSPAPP